MLFNTKHGRSCLASLAVNMPHRQSQIRQIIESLSLSFSFSLSLSLSSLSLSLSLSLSCSTYVNHGLFAVYINVKENVATGDEVRLLKQYIAWNFDQHHKAHPEQMCVVLMDMSGASVGNMVSPELFVYTIQL